MAKKNRETLKNYFKNGSLPSQDEFGDLIDSNLNVIDEGFDKSIDEGLKISSLNTSGKLISFFKSIPLKNALWFIGIDSKTDNLVVGNNKNQQALSLSQETMDAGPETAKDDCVQEKTKIGINIKAPAWELDVGGVIRSEGRIGVGQKAIPADGLWHDITEALSGCHAFEVMAGVGGPKKSGKYALLHAFALNTYNPKGWFFNFFNLKKRIRSDQSYYRSISDKLALRWEGESRKYTLQLRTNSNYGEDIWIQYSLTKLWFDEEMSQSRTSALGKRNESATSNRGTALTP